MPNPAVKLPIADGTAEGICGRVGRRRAFFQQGRQWSSLFVFIENAVFEIVLELLNML